MIHSSFIYLGGEDDDKKRRKYLNGQFVDRPARGGSATEVFREMVAEKLNSLF